MSAKTAEVVLSLGSNIEDRFGYLQEGFLAVNKLSGFWLTGVSSVYETVPVDTDAQADFLNAVVVGQTDIPPTDLLFQLLKIETKLGRVRTYRRGPRTLDIDIISYGQLRQAGEFLTLPHPRAAARAFVIVPWLEVDPDASLPGVGKVAYLEVDASGVRRCPDLVLG
ncbi:MAG: 2-amino-4-hydroxy-6-hydroxymethyldihydropteridine diphosphokinase [Propionibacteriaceae bacterium]|jgi:2-amino-4-hydroxy-6-hydroxymethyldihydropteridine diphosphokinase|nr:2-amino-4-hydroxy-6-hydroxymethyldihydropteridine diphosphokinase [Propionibacteriaceae bacterium]